MQIKVGFAKVPSKTDVPAGAAGGLNVNTLSPAKAGRAGLTIGGGVDGFLGEDAGLGNTGESLGGEAYAASLVALPEPDPLRRVDQSRLREMRKRLENPTTDLEEVMSIFMECYDEAVELCTDYIGNVVLQKLIERTSPQTRCHLIEKLTPYLATLGVHKNGTWVVQKIIDTARTQQESHLLVLALKPYAPCLLLDQFGNYVIQCCLRLPTNQFIFDAMQAKVLEIGTGRFGARAMRSCLESQYTTRRQQKHVAVAITQVAVQLVTNLNGSILVGWLVDASLLPGRFRVLAPRLVEQGDLAALCRHKLASGIVLKIVSQRSELDARDLLLKEIFSPDTTTSETSPTQPSPTSASPTLRDIISDHTVGTPLIQKILSTATLTAEEKHRLSAITRATLTTMSEVKTNPMAYKRLIEEVTPAYEQHHVSGEVVSPLTPNLGYFVNPYETEQQYYSAGAGYSGGLPVGIGYGIPQQVLQQQQQQQYVPSVQQQQQQFYGGYQQQQSQMQQQYQGYQSQQQQQQHRDPNMYHY
ncbi:hypothetical protein HDU99_002001 [Rhizoclosmatium hyalinum]|nr:hypothetical protein HDU99_002001 [Rhizoclosmatium hyalinum]